MSIGHDIEAAALSALKIAATALPPPYGIAFGAVLAATETPSFANVYAAITAVSTAIEAAEAKVPSGDGPAHP